MKVIIRKYFLNKHVPEIRCIYKTVKLQNLTLPIIGVGTLLKPCREDRGKNSDP